MQMDSVKKNKIKTNYKSTTLGYQKYATNFCQTVDFDCQPKYQHPSRYYVNHPKNQNESQCSLDCQSNFKA